MRSQSVKVVRQCDVGVTDTAHASLQRRRTKIKKTNLFRVSEIQKKREKKRGVGRKRDTFVVMSLLLVQCRCAVLFQRNTTYEYYYLHMRRRVDVKVCVTFRKSAQYDDDDDDEFDEFDERVVAFSSNSRVRRAASTQKNETTFLNTPLSNGFLNVPSAARR